MAVSLTINGQTFSYPERGDQNWGPDATDWASAVTTGMLQKAGGSFTLLSEVDFGATYGLKSSYFKSRSSNIADSGVIRLANADNISWRNNANSGNLVLSTNSSDQLTFQGVALVSGPYVASVTDTSTIDLTLTGTALSADIVSGSITNTQISASASIDLSKLATITANKVLVSDSSGVVTASTISDTELSYLSTVNSNVQDQLNDKISIGDFAAKGDLLVATSIATPTALPVGTNGQVLTVNSSTSTGVAWATPAAAPESSVDLTNLSLAISFNSNAMTIAVKDKAGNDPSAGSPVKVGFRSATLTTGNFVTRTITSGLSLTVSSGSTLGTISGAQARIWVYLIDNAGTVELAIAQRAFAEDQLLSTTAEGGAGAADSASTLYSTTARSNVAFRMIGYFDITQATPGAWTTSPTKFQVGNYWQLMSMPHVFTATKNSAQSLTNTLSTITNWTGGSSVGEAISWNATTGIATIKISGMYQINGQLASQSVASTFCTFMRIFAAGSILVNAASGNSNDTGVANCSPSYVFLSAGQTVYAQGSFLNTTSNSAAGDGFNILSIARVAN